MTVSSLWTVLDEAGCGTPCGIDDFDRRGQGDVPEQQTILAVDLSIWICEGIASTALSSFHSDPSLYLVYQRTMKLLKLGIGLVFVTEGQTRRVHVPSSQTHELKQRRSGSQFWQASKRCQALLQVLGVPVICAQAEGEAMCALLNATGIVDGCISNDGDCFLFGAKTIYTNFSSENLEARKVMRYTSENLVANLNGRTLQLSREDLVAFAVLCGSDMCGGGIPHCGYKKAVQFIHACRSLKHRYNDRTCLDELLSWSDAADESTKPILCLDCDDDGPRTIPSRCCSLCLHPGDKLSHEKHGCTECGTGPGEGCYVVTSSEKFLRLLKEKALGSIAPRNIVNGYFSLNSNNIPSSMSSLKSKPYSVSTDASNLFATSLLLKGRTNETSQEYIKQTLPALLARLDLWDTGPRNKYISLKEKYKPIPMRIEKSLVRQSENYFEITWSINIDPSVDAQFEFSTFECQSLVGSTFPQLVKKFHQEERRRQQGRAEDERRKKITVTKSNQSQRGDFMKKPQGGNRRKRNFDGERIRKVPKTLTAISKATGLGNDVMELMDYLPNDSPGKVVEGNDELDIDRSKKSPGEQNDITEYEGSITDTKTLIYEANGEAKDHNCSQGSNQRAEEKESYQYCSLGEHHWDDGIKSNGTEDGDVFSQFGDRCNPHPSDHSFPKNVARRDGYGKFVLQSGNDVAENEYKQPFPQDEQLNDVVDSLGDCDGDLYCSGKKQDTNKGTTSNFVANLSQNQIFCDMGAMSVQMTPIVSRRWRLF